MRSPDLDLLKFLKVELPWYVTMFWGEVCFWFCFSFQPPEAHLRRRWLKFAHWSSCHLCATLHISHEANGNGIHTALSWHEFACMALGFTDSYEWVSPFWRDLCWAKKAGLVFNDVINFKYIEPRLRMLESRNDFLAWNNLLLENTKNTTSFALILKHLYKSTSTFQGVPI